jgi:hypothetical protein
MKKLIKKPDWQADPGRDWRRLVKMGLALLVIMLAGGWWLNHQLTSQTPPPPSELAVPTINRADLEKAAALIKLREERFQNFLTATSTPIDPSH